MLLRLLTLIPTLTLILNPNSIPNPTNHNPNFSLFLYKQYIFLYAEINMVQTTTNFKDVTDFPCLKLATP